MIIKYQVVLGAGPKGPLCLDPSVELFDDFWVGCAQKFLKHGVGQCSRRYLHIYLQ
jgi:hypothetical protein